MWMGMVGDVKLVRGSHLVVVSTVVWCVFVNVSCLGKGEAEEVGAWRLINSDFALRELPGESEASITLAGKWSNSPARHRSCGVVPVRQLTFEGFTLHFSFTMRAYETAKMLTIAH